RWPRRDASTAEHLGPRRWSGCSKMTRSPPRRPVTKPLSETEAGRDRLRGTLGLPRVSTTKRGEYGETTSLAERLTNTIDRPQIAGRISSLAVRALCDGQESAGEVCAQLARVLESAARPRGSCPTAGGIKQGATSRADPHSSRTHAADTVHLLSG